MNIVSLISREWSYEITSKLIDYYKSKTNSFLLVTKNIQIKKGKNKLIKINKKFTTKHIKIIKSFSPDLILAYGWSDYISKEIRKIAPCLILHPSKLPKYRGGSPIQNQILDGKIKSAVSIIYAEENLDSGNILFQEDISFDGYLNEILNRIIKKGIKGSKKIIKLKKLNKLKSVPQNHRLATFYKRRKPIQSKISLQDFKKFNARHFYNLVRGLQEPYPLVYIECKNKTKLYLERVLLDKKNE